MSSVGQGNRESRGWGYCLPAGWCCMEGGIQLRKYGIWWQFGRGTQHSDPSSCPFSSYPGATPPSLSSPNSSSLQSTLPLQEPRVSCHERDSVHSPFKIIPWFLTGSRLCLMDRIPTDFYSQILWGLLFPALVFWAGEPSMGLTPHFP